MRPGLKFSVNTGFFDDLVSTLLAGEASSHLIRFSELRIHLYGQQKRDKLRERNFKLKDEEIGGQ